MVKRGVQAVFHRDACVLHSEKGEGVDARDEATGPYRHAGHEVEGDAGADDRHAAASVGNGGNR